MVTLYQSESHYNFSTLPHKSGRKLGGLGPEVQKKCQIRENANCGADTPENEEEWAHCISSPSSLHIFLTNEENCIIKVEVE